MKTIHTYIAILIIAFGTLFVEGGQTVLTNSFEFGSIEAVEAHNIPFIDTGVVTVYQKDTNGNTIDFNSVVYFGSIKDRHQLDTWFQVELQKGLNNILTSTNGNRDGIYKIFAYTSNWDLASGQFDYFKEFNLVYTNGQYTLPDFSQAKMSLSRKTLYKVQGIEWAILEIFDKDGQLLGITDSRFEPDPWYSGVDTANGLLILPTDFIIGDTDYKIKLVVVSNGDYKVYDGTGKQIPETPATMRIQVIIDGVKNIVVTGGDAGRRLILQGSSNMVDWVDLNAGHVVGFPPGYFYSEAGTDSGFSFKEQGYLPQGFFRVKKDISPTGL